MRCAISNVHANLDARRRCFLDQQLRGAALGGGQAGDNVVHRFVVTLVLVVYERQHCLKSGRAQLKHSRKSHSCGSQPRLCSSRVAVRSVCAASAELVRAAGNADASARAALPRLGALVLRADTPAIARGSEPCARTTCGRLPSSPAPSVNIVVHSAKTVRPGTGLTPALALVPQHRHRQWRRRRALTVPPRLQARASTGKRSTGTGITRE